MKTPLRSVKETIETSTSQDFLRRSTAHPIAVILPILWTLNTSVNTQADSVLLGQPVAIVYGPQSGNKAETDHTRWQTEIRFEAFHIRSGKVRKGGSILRKRETKHELVLDERTSPDYIRMSTRDTQSVPIAFARPKHPKLTTTHNVLFKVIQWKRRSRKGVLLFLSSRINF